MTDFHGIIFAYNSSPELRELARDRTAASLPFGGRYRLIDFALSSMRNAGITDCGVIMQRDYQSLLDHLGSGKTWDMAKRSGGMKMLPPFGLPAYHKGNYTGTIEALNAVASYVKDIKQDNVVLMIGSLCANIDLTEAIQSHIRSGAEITAVCTEGVPAPVSHRYLPDADGLAGRILFERTGGEGVAALECYVIAKKLLLEMMDRCRSEDKYRFHRDAIAAYLEQGGKVNIYIHRGYAKLVRSVDAYYRTNMDMLNREIRTQLFPADRPVRTRAVEEVSTYYGENAMSRNSLVADNCRIEGSIENCVVFSGVRIAKGAKLSNCIIMKGCEIKEWADLSYVVADKFCSFKAGITLTGSPNLPIVVPKGSDI